MDNYLLKKQHIREAGITREINREPTEHHVEDHKTHVKESNTLLISFIKGSLGFDIATPLCIGCSLHTPLWVLENTSNALGSYIQNHAGC